MSVKPYEGNDKVFLKACELAGLKQVTRRQFTKYGKGYGAARARLHEAVRAVDSKATRAS